MRLTRIIIFFVIFFVFGFLGLMSAKNVRAEVCEAYHGDNPDGTFTPGCYGGTCSSGCCNVSVPAVGECSVACFLPGTKVASPNGDKNIEDVKIGDSVTSFEGNKILESKVSNIYKVVRDFYYSLTAGDYKVKVTAEHPFYIGNNNFKEASKLKTGDTVYVLEKDKMSPKIVSSNTRINEPTDAYNLSVDNTKTFFANDFAVHNKACTGCGCWCMCGSTGSGTGEGHGCNVDCNPHPDPNNCNGAHPTYDPSGCPWGQEPGPWTATAECTVFFDGWFSAPGACCNSRINHCKKGNGDCDESETCLGWYANRRFCAPKCDPNAWGAFGACSVSCGGGTQIAYSACGEATYRECNAQPCKIPPWWQVKNSDISSNGDLVSNVPLDSLFDLAPTGGYPGVPAYGGSTILTPSNVSATAWLANSPSVGQKVYNYDYFVNQIPTDILASINTVDIANVAGSLTSDAAVPDANNYYWYKYDGALNGNQPLTISGVDIGTRKVVLLVDNADVNITGDINLTDSQGFFMMVVKRNISVDPTVGGSTPNMEGLYEADGQFNTGAAAIPLYVRGTIAAYGGVSLQRDLGTGTANAIPAEFFEYAPDQVMLLPKAFSTRKINWKEVAP